MDNAPQQLAPGACRDCGTVPTPPAKLNRKKRCPGCVLTRMVEGSARGGATNAERWEKRRAAEGNTK